MVILGPRQLGKATLARAIADQRPASVYLDRKDQDRLAEQTLLLREYESCLAALDEIRRVPDLLNSLWESSIRGGEAVMVTVNFTFWGPSQLTCCGSPPRALLAE